MRTFLRTRAVALRHRLRRFGRDTRGNFAIILALSAVPLIGLSGLALDYGVALTAKARLDSAADAAALAGTIDAVSSMHKQQNVGLSDWATARNYGVARAQKVFAPTAAVTKWSQTTTWSVNIDWDGNTVKTTVSYSSSVPTSLGRIFNINSIPVTGAGVASQNYWNSITYKQVIFLVDNSSSMGIGANADAITTLQNTFNCAFACHDSGRKFVADCPTCAQPYRDYYTAAKQLSIPLKMDAVSLALQDFTDNAAQTNPYGTDKLVVGINTFGTFFIPNYLSVTADMSQAKAAAAALQLEDATNVWYYEQNHGAFDSAHAGFTYTTNALQQTLANLTNVGDGSSPLARKTYVILITDGVEDTYDTNLWGGRRTGQFFDPTACQALKANPNITLVTVATPYPQFTNSSLYDHWVAPVASNIVPALRDCSSDANKYFIEATDGTAIRTAATTLFQTIQSDTSGNPSLTQ